MCHFYVSQLNCTPVPHRGLICVFIATAAVLCRLLNDCLYLSDLGIDIVEFIKRLNESGESSIARSNSYKKDIAIFLEVVVTRVTDGRTEETDGQIKILGHIESSVQCQPLECSWSIICNLP